MRNRICRRKNRVPQPFLERWIIAELFEELRVIREELGDDLLKHFAPNSA